MIVLGGRLSKGDPVEQALTEVLLPGLTSSVRRYRIRVFLFSGFRSSAREHLSEWLLIRRQLLQAEEFPVSLGTPFRQNHETWLQYRGKEFQDEPM